MGSNNKKKKIVKFKLGNANLLNYNHEPQRWRCCKLAINEISFYKCCRLPTATLWVEFMPLKLSKKYSEHNASITETQSTNFKVLKVRIKKLQSTPQRKESI